MEFDDSMKSGGQEPARELLSRVLGRDLTCRIGNIAMGSGTVVELTSAAMHSEWGIAAGAVAIVGGLVTWGVGSSRVLRDIEHRQD